MGFSSILILVSDLYVNGKKQKKIIGEMRNDGGGSVIARA